MSCNRRKRIILARQKLITEITEEQKARFPEFVTRWTNIGLCTDPADRPRAEAGVREAYRCGGLEPPKEIIWCSSPSDMINKRNACLEEFGLEKSDGIQSACYGQHDANMLSFYDYFREVMGLVEGTAKMAGLWEVAKSAGWWIPHENVCWICERHNVLKRNAAGQLHCEDGPALAYPDGWSVYSIDGIRLDEQIIMRPETQTLAQLDGEQNADIRSYRINRYGWVRYLKDVNAVLLDSRQNEVAGLVDDIDSDGKLLRRGLAESLYAVPDGTRMFFMECVTGRPFNAGCPEEVNTCEEAQIYLKVDPKINVVGET